MDEENLQYLKESLERGFVKELGITLVEVEPGNVMMELNVGENHENIYHMVHGGVIYTLADTAAGFACRTFGCRVVTSTASISYLNAAKEGTKRIYCKSRCIKHGRKLIVQSVDVFDDTDRILANGTFTFCVL